jgi:ABC-type arginine transport system permease subunit
MWIRFIGSLIFIISLGTDLAYIKMAQFKDPTYKYVYIAFLVARPVLILGLSLFYPIKHLINRCRDRSDQNKIAIDTETNHNMSYSLDI